MKPHFLLPLLLFFALIGQTRRAFPFANTISSSLPDTVEKTTSDTAELSKEIKFNKNGVSRFYKDSPASKEQQTMAPMGSHPPDQPTLPGPGEPPIVDPYPPTPYPPVLDPDPPYLDPNEPVTPPAPSEAGSTAGTLDVSATGGASYTIPITLPPALGSAIPSLALIYNSQSGNGIAGYGWKIDGLSTISRIPSTLFHDNNPGSINFDQNDRFALDGQRLMLKSGTYGGNGAEYQTEKYSNIKITSRGVSPYGAAYGPEYFEILYPDGSKAVYGSSTNSRTPFEYAITYSESPLGARISYTYQQNNNTLLISQMSYGSTGSASGINIVNFSYITAARAEQAYSGGQAFYRNLLLNKISIIAYGSAYRNYKLTYNTISPTNYQRLESVQEFNGAEDHSFPPVQFSYSATSEVITSQAVSATTMISGIAGNNSQIVTADFTGDGSMDFLLYPTAKDKFWAFYDLVPDGQYPRLASQVNTGTFLDIFPATWLTHTNKITGGQGIILVKDNQNYTFKFEMLSSGIVTPTYYQYERLWTNPPRGTAYFSLCDYSQNPGDPLDFTFLPGDFNGDGLTDVIAISMRKTVSAYTGCSGVDFVDNSTAYMINMDRRITSGYITNLGSPAVDYMPGDKLYTGDFNGDGKTDILLVQLTNMYVYTINNGTIQILWQLSDYRVNSQYAVLPGDYNGDGKTDIMFSTGYNNVFTTFMSTGKAFVKSEKNQPFTNRQSTFSGGILNQYYLIPNDIDGDGKTDIIYSQTVTQNNNTTGTAVVTSFLNTVITSGAQATFITSATTSMSTVLKHYPIPIFLNPDRRNQKLEFGFLSDDNISLFKFGKDQRKETHLSSILNNGVTHSITYKPLLAGSSSEGVELYQPGYNQIFPYVDLPNAAGVNVVSKITRYSSSPTVSQVFGYGEAVTHYQGLGFMGFGKLIRSNWNTGSGDANRLFSISIHDPQLRGAKTKSFTSKYTYISPSILNVSLSNPPPASSIADAASQYDYINRSDIAWQTQLLANKVFVNNPVATASKDMLTGTFATKTINYDTYYNQIKVTSNISNTGTKTEEFTYGNSVGSTYYIGRMLARQTTMSNGTSTFSTREEFTYTGWLPTQIKRRGNNTAFITEDLVYDAYGNVTQRTITVPEGTQRTVTMGYDPTKRFLLKVTDSDGQVTTSSYNLSTGSLLSITNPYGQIKQNTYDTWGRLISNTYFVGDVTSTITYERDGSNNTVITKSDSEGRSSVSIVNPLGQTIETKVKDLSGQYIGKAFQYDAYGRKTGESEPAQPGSYNQWNYIEYDEYDRVKKQTSFTGLIKSIAYSGLSTTANDGIKSVTTTSNALGNTISIQDPGGTINYTYFANGNLKSADYSGIVQRIEQDGWGRKTQLTDPSAGQYQYEYDGFGQLTKETSPKGVTSYTYDVYGKLTQKKINGDNTNIQLDYNYDGATKLLTSTIMTNADGNNSSYSYAYDQQKRLNTVTEDNPFANFVTGYTYNGQNRIAIESHQAKNKLNNITVTKAMEMLYQNGEPLQATLQGSGQILWKINSLDAKGRISSELQGSSLKTTYIYDQYGLPQQRTVDRVSGSPATLMSLGYSFDSQRSLLNSRSNSSFSWSESFSYDNLDRLTAFNDNDGNNSQSYDNRGRITSSSVLGNYSYADNSYKQIELELNPSANTWYQSHSLQQISYNSFKSPVTIHEQGNERISFQYNAVLNRSTMYYGSEQEDKMQRRFRRHYSEDGAVEITNDILSGTTSFVFYLGGNAYSAPAIWKEVYAGGQATQNLYYLQRDHLRSIVLITNEQGNPVEKRQFDAWGNIVRLTDGNGNNLPAFVIIDRGYTGHEHLLGVGLIHMNGRLYDSKIHRFLSPDNYVQDPYSTQNFNRFGYVLNNPLKYTDPNGEFLVPMLIGAAIGVLTNGVNNAFHDRPFFAGAGKSAIIGGLGGALSFGIGQAVSGMSGLEQVLVQTTAHGYLGGAMSIASGGTFGQGFLSGAFGSLAGTGTGVLFENASAGIKAAGTILGGGVAGGIGSDISGGSFWDGFRNGTISAGLNHGIHSGAFGEGLMIASITGRLRHLMGPDAIGIAGTADVSAGISVGIEKGKLAVLHGPEKGIYDTNDMGVGIGGISASVGAEIVKYYTSASTVLKKHFYGARWEGNASATIFGLSIGGTAVYGTHDQGFTIGIGGTIGVDAMPFNIGINGNRGITEESFMKLKDFRQIFYK